MNDSGGNEKGLTAHAEVMDLNGTVRWDHTATVDSSEDSTATAFPMEFPAGLAKTHFIRLTLEKDGLELSRNFYLRGLTENDYTGIRDLKPANVAMKSRIRRDGESWQMTAELENRSAVPALMVRVKVVRSKSGDPILPALFDDNYIALMPHEKRTLHVSVLDVDTRGEKPRLALKGYNLAGSSAN